MGRELDVLVRHFRRPVLTCDRAHPVDPTDAFLGSSSANLISRLKELVPSLAGFGAVVPQRGGEADDDSPEYAGDVAKLPRSPRPDGFDQ